MTAWSTTSGLPEAERSGARFSRSDSKRQWPVRPEAGRAAAAELKNQRPTTKKLDAQQRDRLMVKCDAGSGRPTPRNLPGFAQRLHTRRQATRASNPILFPITIDYTSER